MSSSADRRGLLFIVSAPSGAGKTTLVERLVEQTPQLRMSRSYTSRAARQGETDGVDYNFVTRDRFEAMVAAGEFLEWAEVFGNLYGTCAADTERHARRGDDVVLVIDVQGARKVRRPRHRSHHGVRDAAVVRGARAAAARPQQGQRGRRFSGGCRWRATRSPAFAEYDYVVVNDELTPPSTGCAASSSPSGRG